MPLLRRTIIRVAPRLPASVVTGSGVYIVGTNTVALAAAASSSHWLFWLGRDDWAAWTSSMLRIVSGCLVNGTGPAVTLTVGLYPVGTPSGGATILDPNLGTVVAGSTVAFASPAAGAAAAPAASTSFAFPTGPGGWYCLAVNASGAMAANSQVIMPMRLEVSSV